MCCATALGDEPSPLDIDGEDAVELFLRDFQSGLPQGCACGGDRDVDLSQRLDSAGQHAPNLVGSSDVGGLDDRLVDRRGRLGEASLVDIRARSFWSWRVIASMVKTV
jgi:hypothetical protein